MSDYLSRAYIAGKPLGTFYGGVKMGYKFRGIELPEHLQESIDAYVNGGRPTGGFLRACIENNLNEAVARADADNLSIIPAIVGYLYNRCPSGSWGRSDSWGNWIEAKRKERESHE